MRITILAVGTLGSVQPFIALGLGLIRAGHRVTVATTTNLADYVRECGIADCVPVVGDTRRWTAWLARGRSREKMSVVVPTLARRPEKFQALVEDFFARSVEAAKGADVLISSVPGFPVGQPIANMLGVPHVSAFVQPFHATRSFPQIFWPQFAWGAGKGQETYNLVTHRLTLWGLQAALGPAVRRARRRVLGAREHHYTRDSLVLYGYSPACIPKPADWGPEIHVTGYWFLDRISEWRPSAELVTFLGAGEPPVYLGLGSLAGVRPEIMDMAVDALRRAGRRGVIATGWSSWSLARPAEDILVVDSVPHDWLFPRMSAVVHHAGAGTTGAGLRAGRPAVTIPLMYDQFFFAHHVAAAGVGPHPLSPRTVSGEQLAAAINRVAGDRMMRRRAEQLGETVRSEAGVERAVQLIEERFS
uniref:Putative glycosyl transferase n=1 Tax=Streptomyces argenteolus TaxID=67274 RepID=A9ZNU7_9ACTN|nr:putative glycosyl transferase [Streptomyces argenteolus]